MQQTEHLPQQQQSTMASTSRGNTCADVFIPRAGAFQELELRETKLKILDRYTNVNVIGAGAQGLVLYEFKFIGAFECPVLEICTRLKCQKIPLYKLIFDFLF